MKVGLSPSFEEQQFEHFGHSPEYYLRASTPQREKEERKRRKELVEANEDGEGIEKDFHSEDDVKSFTRNELLLKPKVRYCELSKDHIFSTDWDNCYWLYRIIY